MGADILSIGVSGLSAAQRQLTTTSHNVANVNTVGYSRQRAELEANIPAHLTGSGFIGTGVSVQTTVRLADEFLERQIRDANSRFGQYDSFYELAAQIDNILANPTTGLAPTMESFYSALQEANDDPSSTSARQVLLTEANVLTDRFELINDHFVELNSEVNDRLTNITNEITSIASSIANLNINIIQRTGAGNGNIPNDLMDQREVLIKELSEKIDISVVYQDDGAVNIFIGSGQTLVISGNAASVSTEINKYNSLQQDIILTQGNARDNITATVSGGELEGILSFREQVLDPSINSLGRIAIALTEEMNTQHRLGMTIQGTTEPYPLGGDFFTDLTGTPQVLDGQLNSTGSYTAAIFDSKALTTSDYQLDFTAAGASYRLTRLSDNSIIYSGAVLADLQSVAQSEGFSISEISTPTDDETFLIRPTAAAASNIGVYVNNVLDIALASPIIAGEATSVTGGSVNSGSGNISLPTNTTALNIPISDGTIPPSASNLVEITLTYNDALKQFDITTSPAASPAVMGSVSFDNTDPSHIHGLATQLPGADYNNIQFTLSGIPNDGDKFVIKNNTSPYDDNRNGLLMAALQTAKTIENGSSDFQGAYGLLVTDVGAKTHAAEVDLKAQFTLLEEAHANRESYSGVNLDEEAALLLKYQQAYQASSKVISSANQMFQDLLNAI